MHYEMRKWFDRSRNSNPGGKKKMASKYVEVDRRSRPRFTFANTHINPGLAQGSDEERSMAEEQWNKTRFGGPVT